MRIIFYTGICLIIFGTAWVLYLDFENKRFVEMLPQLPPTVNQSMEKTEDLPNIENPSVLGTDSTENTFVQDNHLIDPSIFENLESQPVPDSRPLQKFERNTDYHDHGREEANPSGLAQGEGDQESHLNGPVYFDRKITRKGLIQQFGDIPEIDIVLQHMPDRIEAGKVIIHRNIGTFADDIEYKKAIAKLWPTPANIQAVETAKVLASWKQGDPLPPGVEVHYEHDHD